MMPGADIQSAMTIAKSAPIAMPHKTNDPVAAQKAAQAFEGVFVSQFLGSMFEGISSDGPFGGGEGEQMFRSLMIEQYGKQIEARGGFGLARTVTAELLRTQETPQSSLAQP